MLPSFRFELETPVDPIIYFFIFSVKICHFSLFEFYLYVTNTQAYQQKTEKFFVSDEKSYIVSAAGLDGTPKKKIVWTKHLLCL